MRPIRSLIFVLALVAICSASVFAQAGRGGASQALQDATQALRDGRDADALAVVRRELQTNPSSTGAANLLDSLGQTKDARAVFAKALVTAADPAAKSQVQRAIAMSYAFDGDCANAAKYEQLVIDYWVTREQAEPQNAFYQEGEIANEAARVCIDAGDLNAAEKWYRKGTELGLKEPGHTTHPKSLWDFRLAHALGRLAARRGDAAEATRQIAAARQALDGDPTMAAQQERFFPYLVGYVALYTNDLKTAETELTKATTTSGNATDPFMLCLLAMTDEKLGDRDKAREMYTKAYGLATAHNPPSAYTRRIVRQKLGVRVPTEL